VCALKVNLHQIQHFIRHFFVAKRNGHGVHSPFAYKLCEEVFYNTNTFYDFDELKKVRNQLLQNKQVVTMTDFGAGSKTFSSNSRQIKQIADKGVSKTFQSELLYKLIHFLNCNTCLELGTSIGLNTLYLARACKTGQVISIEGNKELSDFAGKLTKENNIHNTQFISAKFDDVLPDLLKGLPVLDFLYVDGNHRYDATLNYFNLALSKQQESTVIVFDDIYWSKGMTRAWQEIKKNPKVTLSIDAFYFGIIFFKKELKEKTDLKIYI
jgi:predicted O-methyltransferase YrrM